MYYPFLRGRQNELLAIRELLKEKVLSNLIVPIVEPVKLSPTLISTLEAFVAEQHPIVLIRNPLVGEFELDKKNPKNGTYLQKLNNILNEPNSVIQYGVYVRDGLEEFIQDGNLENMVTICLHPDQINLYEQFFSNREVRVVVPYSSSFRRIRNARILLENKFNKKSRNVEYLNNEDEFFSDEHRYYKNDGYVAFSDYTIVGDEYIDSGFAPYAVAIHIVYFDTDKNLRVRHFVSEENDDISDPAGKFYQALTKFHKWHETNLLNTRASNILEKIYKEERYPGLGAIKKLSIMNHLELISQFLDD